jgi:hypothetical protein
MFFWWEEVPYNFILIKLDPNLSCQRVCTSFISKKGMEQLPLEVTLVDSIPAMSGPETLS